MKREKIIKANSKREIYLEVYIREDGDLIINPMTKDTLSAFRAISDNQEEQDIIYCG